VTKLPSEDGLKSGRPLAWRSAGNESTIQVALNPQKAPLKSGRKCTRYGSCMGQKNNTSISVTLKQLSHASTPNGRIHLFSLMQVDVLRGVRNKTKLHPSGCIANRFAIKSTRVQTRESEIPISCPPLHTIPSERE